MPTTATPTPLPATSKHLRSKFPAEHPAFGRAWGAAIMAVASSLGVPSAIAQISCPPCTYQLAGVSSGIDINGYWVDIIQRWDTPPACPDLSAPGNPCRFDGYYVANNAYLVRYEVCSTSCAGYTVTFSKFCDGRWQYIRAYIPGYRGSACAAQRELAYGRIRARVRANGTAVRHQFSCVKTTCRTPTNGVRGFLPGQVILERIAQPNETYRWSRAETGQFLADGLQPTGSTVSGATTSVLTLEGIDTPDEGLYLLHATPSGGVEALVEGMQVYVDRPLPDYTHFPQDRTACLGGSTTFQVVPVGTDIAFRWFKDGVLLNDGPSTDGTIAGSRTPTLTIDGIVATSAGGYVCSMTRAGYGVTTFEATLTVSINTTPPTILGHPQSVAATVGTLAYMIADVDVQPGEVPSFQWRKNGVPILDGAGVEGTQTEQLVFASVNATHAGTYDCVVSRGCASTTTNAATLTIATPCAADLDNGSGTGARDGSVDINDLLFFLSGFEAGSSTVDLDNGTSTGTPDNAVDINDLLFFLARFEAGC